MRRVTLCRLMVVLSLWHPQETRAKTDPKLQAYVIPTALNRRAKPSGKSEILGALLEYDPVVTHDRARVGSTPWYAG